MNRREFLKMVIMLPTVSLHDIVGESEHVGLTAKEKREAFLGELCRNSAIQMQAASLAFPIEFPISFPAIAERIQDSIYNIYIADVRSG